MRRGGSRWIRNVGAVAMIVLVLTALYQLKNRKPALHEIAAPLHHRRMDNLLEFFPKTEGDGSRISWAHAVNNQHLLKATIAGSAMVVEADVSPRRSPSGITPVMAHPPDTTSDLTLHDFIEALIPTNKSFKLDFKYLDVVEPSLKILKHFEDRIKVPILLNADILVGPTNPISSPVSAERFLELCKRSFPKAILSVGWTSYLDPSEANPVYTDAMVSEMLIALESSKVNQPITFPVRACMAVNSVPQLRRLLSSRKGSTLTVWSSPGDPVDAPQLTHFRTLFSIQSVYYDLPSPLKEEFLRLTSKNKG